MSGAWNKGSGLVFCLHESNRQKARPDPLTALLQDSFLVSASEDEGFLIQKVREQGGEATYLILGSPVGGGHHCGTFDFDEQMLGWGVLLFERLVMDG